MAYSTSLTDPPKSVKSSSKFVFPHGVCQIVETDDMTEMIRFAWTDSYPNVEAYLTDPGMSTHSSIDLSSQKGDKIACNYGNVCTYEISIRVTDLRHPVIQETCSDDTSYKECVEEQTKNIYHKVKFVPDYLGQSGVLCSQEPKFLKSSPYSGA